ncbi:hypothetical protein JTE90_008771 [Oedothorax gibbosus]|uniref:Uncharacterized protein n=1 Tax=Oedothorax gibbosus TaxID=931172 RepID=A0AAV6V6D2_9ARAC|nr:hypothetical protein JTE90_008771 [Oedothorax gibbosus]
MAFLRAHVIFIGLLAYVVAVLNADGDHHYKIEHPPVRHTYRITSAPNVHRHTRKVPGQRIKHVRRHERTNPDIIELSEFGDNYGASYNSDSGDSGSIPSIPEPTSEPATPAPATPAAETPAPATPAPATPAPATPAPATPAPGDSSYSSDSSYAEEDYSLLTGSSNSSEYISSFSSGDYSYSSGSSYTATPASGDDSSYSYGSSYTENSSGEIHPSDAGLIPPTPPKATPAPETPAPATPAPEKSSEDACPLPPPVEGFSASLYTAIVVSVDPKILDQELSGGEAAMKLYKVIKEISEEFGLCNGEMIAFSGARGLTNVKKITLLDFVKMASVAVGNTLYNNGVMSCSNDVSLALNQFRNMKKALKDRDPSTFESNVYSFIKGAADLYHSLGLDLGDAGQQVSDTFSQLYVAVGDDKCKANAEKSTDGSCPLPAPVEGFSASFYTANVVTVDPKILDQELSGGEVALLLYKVLKEVLEEFGICNAEMVAFSASRGLANVKKITLIDVFKKASVAIGNALYNNGVMSCSNDVSLALNEFRNTKKALKDRDPKTFENNLYSFVKGTTDLYHSLGLDLEDVSQQTADGFSQLYVAVGDDKCKAKASSCPLPAPVEGFLASLYTAYVVTVDPKILDQELSGGEVALLLYKIVKEYLEGKGVCNAEMIAFSAARGPANVKKITLRDFLKTAWVAIGNTLYNNGVMSCNNDVSLALKQFRNQKEALKGRDPSTFENNLYSYVKGTIDLQQQLGLDLGVIGQQVADTFSQHYVAVGGDECKAKAG